MTTIATEKERRQHKRYDIDSGGFALIRSNGSEVLGSIKDISAGGFSLTHIDDCVDMAELSSLAISLISEKSCFEQFCSGRSIWSKREESQFNETKVKMRCCGVEFEQLNNEKQTQLNQFIDSLQTT
jgi:c-di-GMP-binding flagellar brake protein YcgR